MAGFGPKAGSKPENKKPMNNGSKPAPSKNVKGGSVKPNQARPKNGNARKVNPNQNTKNFNVDHNETSTMRKAPSREVSDKELEKLVEKVELPKFIGSIKSCDEKFFIHMINHSKTKEFDPFIIGSVDDSICENIDQYIRESKEEFVPTDTVDLTNGKKLVTLER